MINCAVIYEAEVSDLEPEHISKSLVNRNALLNYNKSIQSHNGNGPFWPCIVIGGLWEAQLPLYTEERREKRRRKISSHFKQNYSTGDIQQRVIDERMKQELLILH